MGWNIQNKCLWLSEIFFGEKTHINIKCNVWVFNLPIHLPVKFRHLTPSSNKLITKESEGLWRVIFRERSYNEMSLGYIWKEAAGECTVFGESQISCMFVLKTLWYHQRIRFSIIQKDKYATLEGITSLKLIFHH